MAKLVTDSSALILLSKCNLIEKLCNSYEVFAPSSVISEVASGEIIETYINDNCLTDGNADAKKIDPLVYSSGTTQYQRLGEVIGRAFHIGKE